MKECINYKEDCDNAMICPCWMYKYEYTEEKLIEKLKPRPHINNITYPFICRCDIDREERFGDKAEQKIDKKPNPPMPKDYRELKIVNHPKHIIVNGVLYEKIDDSVMVVANGYGETV